MSRTRMMLGGGLAIMAVAGVLYAARGESPDADHLLAEQHRGAERIRDNAANACASAMFRDCLRMLNEAKRLDPAGDQDPKVQSLRAMASAGTDP